jgi:PhzF family phenazine biosynthesis protein
MPVTLYIVDAFTDSPFKGNPAAVCLTAESLSETLMQLIAAEVNLSETAFLVPTGDGFSLRWFTPKAEVALCGHATLASAHALWESGALPGDKEARFETKSGLLTATKNGSWIEMDFPAEPVIESVCQQSLALGLGVAPCFVGRNRFDYFVEVKDEQTVLDLKPDFTALKTIETRGVTVTAAGTEFDYVARSFFPRLGVDEDPVCGSAHTGLAPFWGARLQKGELLAKQVSSRGGILKLRVLGERVRIAGQAVTVMKSEFLAVP